jgi:hypothetical protein
MCHRGLRFCDVPTRNSSEIYNDERTLSDLQVYPEDEDEILTTWGKRILGWVEIDRNTAGRSMSCGWGVGSCGTISEYSY